MMEGLLEMIKKTENGVRTLFYELFDKDIYKVGLKVSDSGKIYVILTFRKKDEVINAIEIQTHKYRFYKKVFDVEKSGYIQCFLVIDSDLPSIHINEINNCLKIIETMIKPVIHKWEKAL